MAGEFYFVQPHTFYLEIVHPVHQIIMFDNGQNVTTIYYPERRKAFIFEGEQPAILPVVSGILAAIQPDYGLSMLGFELYDQDIAGDTLITRWRQTDADASVGEFTLTETGNRLTTVTMSLPTTDGYVTTRFYEYVTTETYDIPVLIHTETVNYLGRALEVMAFPDLEVSPEIPSRIRNFHLPDDTTVEHKRW